MPAMVDAASGEVWDAKRRELRAGEFRGVGGSPTLLVCGSNTADETAARRRNTVMVGQVQISRQRSEAMAAESGGAAEPLATPYSRRSTVMVGQIQLDRERLSKPADDVPSKRPRGAGLTGCNEESSPNEKDMILRE